MDRLNGLMNDYNISVPKLSESIDYGKSIIYFWKNGERQPSSQALIKLAKFFNVSTDYLLGIEDEFGSAPSGSTLSESELRLLKAFNLLDDLTQRKLIADAEFYANRTVGTKTAR